jgi:hypothetical protein
MSGFSVRVGCAIVGRRDIAAERNLMPEKTEEESLDVDALCKECGHAFKVYIERVSSGDRSQPAKDPQTECPVCGCGDCHIGR